MIPSVSIVLHKIQYFVYLQAAKPISSNAPHARAAILFCDEFLIRFLL